MPIDVSWYIEDRIVLVDVYSFVTVQETRQTANMVREYLESTQNQVFLIQDLLRVEGTEFNWAAMRESARILRSPQIIKVINIRKLQNVFIRVGIEFFNRALGLSTHDVETWEAAIDYLKTRDASIMNVL